MIKRVLIFISILFVISCSSSDENVRVISRYGFSARNFKNAKTVILPFALYLGSDKELFNKAYKASYKKFIKNMRLTSPEIAEVMLSNAGVLSLFSEILSDSILSNQEKWAHIGKKIGAKYLVVFSFDKPKHTRERGSYRQFSETSINRDASVPASKKVYVDINMWYLKGSVTVIDVLKGKAVYMLTKETKSGYSRRSAAGTNTPSTFREFISGLKDEQIPTLQNAIYLFFKGVFKSWD